MSREWRYLANYIRMFNVCTKNYCISSDKYAILMV